MLALILNNFLTILLLLYNCEAKLRSCRTFQNGFNEKARHEIIQKEDFTTCPPSTSPFSIYSVRSGINISRTQELLVCWVKDVKAFALQFEHSVQKDDVISAPGVTVRSCVNLNDTVVYHNKPHTNNGTFHLLLTLPTAWDDPLFFKAFYSHKTRGIYYGHHRLLQYKYTTQPPKRRKREVEQTVAFTPSNECGETRSCFRNGAAGCGHFDCTYFLSYNTSENVVDIELSARTTGWVAVGFSSDDKMGGDEVIVCRQMRSGEIDARTYQNPFAHQDPKIKEDSNVLTLKTFQIKDGYVFCHLSRPLSAKNHQDLSNEWHQLYAYGPVSTETPTFM